VGFPVRFVGDPGQFQDVEIPEDGPFRTLQLGGDLLDAVAAPALDEFQDAEGPGESACLAEPPVRLGSLGPAFIGHRRLILRIGLSGGVVEAQGDPESLLHGSQVASGHTFVLGILGLEFDVTQPEAVDDPWKPIGYRGIISVDDQVAGVRMCDPSTRQARTVVAEATLRAFGVLTPGGGQVLSTHRARTHGAR
jgi:hypothetical protein